MTEQELNELPSFYLSINPQTDGYVNAFAVTDDPAHESMYLAFSGEKEKQLFTASDARQEILGAAIIPDKKILRKPNQAFNAWHTVQFSASDIRLMAKEFFKNGFQHNINFNHTTQSIPGYFFQSGIVGNGIGDIQVNQLSLPDGTWVLGAKIDDLNTYNSVKTFGFSAEGLFNYSVYQGFNVDGLDDEQLLIKDLKKIVQYLKKR
ncbi:XkdF-like putative serine protease domain-containing protein [Pedobacter sp. L105]|uniref:XkdF-like putative serine protease domain-containing protein n=1 Tax=Pedobacter sp. L105 TaxID=1641871 RepID=UPI00131C18FA|nr:XkdF-like putative serine protease domain-containing protein [Pedobacter sp. L105]